MCLDNDNFAAAHFSALYVLHNALGSNLLHWIDSFFCLSIQIR